MPRRKHLLYFTLLAAAIALAGVFSLLEYRRSSALNELAALGYPVTPQAMLAYYHTVPDEQNAWTLLKGLDEKIQYPEGEYSNLPIIGDAEWDPADGPMTPEMRRATEKMLELNADLLETIHEAARRPYLRVPGKVTGEGYYEEDFETGEGSALRDYARLLSLHAFCAISDGYAELAVRDIESGLKFARLQQQQPVSVSLIWTTAVAEHVLGVIPALLKSSSLSGSILSELQLSLQENAPPIAGDYLIALDIAERTHMYYEPSFELKELMDSLLLWENVGESLTNTLTVPYERLCMRYLPALSGVSALREIQEANPVDADTFLRLHRDSYNQYDFFPGLDTWSGAQSCNERMIWYLYRFASTLRFWQLAIALKRHHLQHGAYPPELSALVPELIGELPQVPMEGKDWEYTVDQSGCALECNLGISPRREPLRVELKAE